MKILAYFSAWWQTLKNNFFGLLQINASDINRLRSHSPRLAGFILRHVPCKYIFLDEKMEVQNEKKAL